MENKKNFLSLYSRLTERESGYQIFDSLLSYFVYWLDLRRDEAHLGNYKLDKEQEKIAFEMFKLYGEIADHNGEGLYDFWGDFYMENYSNKHRGQFFTPQPICDMMAKMIIVPDSEKRISVADPCCGSSRMILAAAKVTRNITAYSADIDLTCIKMTLINLAINQIRGYVAWMDSLSMEIFQQYEVYICPFTRLPSISILSNDLPIFKGQMQELVKEKVQEKIQYGQQLSLF